jgi:O-antigen/teichoic acid export membrane protein
VTRTLRALADLPRTRGLELTALLTPLVSLVAGVVVARALGATGRGQIAVVMTTAQVIGWAGGLSIDKALMARASREGPRASAVPIAAGLTVLLSAGGLAAAVSAVVGGLFVDGLALRVAMVVAVLGTVAFDARAAFLIVAERWRSYCVLRFAQPVLYLVGCAVAAAVAGVAPELGVGAFLVAACAGLILPALVIGGLPRVAFRWPHRRQLVAVLGFAGAYHVGNVFYWVGSRIDVMSMPWRFDDGAIGVYAVATSAGQVMALLGAVGALRGLTGQVRPRGVDRGGLALAVIAASLMAAAAGWLLPLVYGSAFVDAVVPARILCLGGVMVYLTQVLNGQLAGAGRAWACASVNLLGLLAFVAGLPWATTIVEVAVAKVVSIAVALLSAWWLARRHLGRARPAEPGSVVTSAGVGP